MPTVSFVLLVIGLIGKYSGISWFAESWIEAIWFLHSSRRSHASFLALGEDACAAAWEMDTVEVNPLLPQGQSHFAPQNKEDL